MLVEALGRRVAAGDLDQVIERDHLSDHGDVLAGRDRHLDQRDLDSEHIDLVLVEPGALVILLVRPFLQVDHDLDALLQADGPDPEHRLHVDDAEPSDLHVMPEQLVPGADQHVAVAARDRDHVVRHQPVAAFDQVERKIAI